MTCEQLAGFATDTSSAGEAAMEGMPGVHEASDCLITSTAEMGHNCTHDL